jgi:glyoxylase-like metal-dependent hydrolase (beta-lactamase superfamily II)
VTLRRSTKLFLALVLVLGLPFYWLLVDNRPGDVPAHPLSIAQLRAEAQRIPGAKPTSIDFEVVSMRRFPGTYYAAGSGIKRRLLGTLVFRLNTPDGPILINSGLTAQDCKAYDCETYFPDRQETINRTMPDARMILFTSEEADHMGGFVASPDWSRIAPKAVLNAEQMPGGPEARLLPWPKDTSALRPPLPSRPVQAVAPGVVLIRTGAHSPGSQMIFVRLANGHEFLFTGDVAPFARNYFQLRAGSRLLTDWLEPEDREQQFAWLKTIRVLRRQAPQLFVVPAHDPDYLLTPGTGRPIKLHFDNDPAIPPGLTPEEEGEF